MHNVLAMALKPQDIVVVLKLCGYGPNRPTFAQMANDLSMSPSEVHAALKRAKAARLIHGPDMNSQPNLSAIEEFLIHGVKYAFPAEHGGSRRGVPTSYAAAPLNQLFAAGKDPIPVWPHPEGLCCKNVATPHIIDAMPNQRKTPLRKFGYDLGPWEELGKHAAGLGTDRGELIRDLLDWWQRKPGAKCPPRPDPAAIDAVHQALAEENAIISGTRP